MARLASDDETPGMNKRLVSSFLWFAAIWVGYEVVWSLTAVPRPIGPVIAFAVAAFVAVDPLGRVWSTVAAGHTDSATRDGVAVLDSGLPTT